MEHFIEHLLGFCGEAHLNIFTIIAILGDFKLVIWRRHKKKSCSKKKKKKNYCKEEKARV